MNVSCPADLPAPPLGKTGWPWTEGSPQLPVAMKDGSSWPKISIVTPSYNQGQFIEETIRSVLLQGYPNLEYLIMDGGSTDESVEIIRKYEPWLFSWTSERDGGQSHAINKGLVSASGTIMTWLNSDDFYMPGCLGAVAQHWNKHPECDFLICSSLRVNEQGTEIGLFVSRVKYDDRGRWLPLKSVVPQPSSFFSRRAFVQYGPLDVNMHYAMDMDFWLRMAGHGVRFFQKDAVITHFRLHEKAKSSAGDLPFLEDMTKKYLRPVLDSTDSYPDRELLIEMFAALLDHYPFGRSRFWHTLFRMSRLSPVAALGILWRRLSKVIASLRTRLLRSLR